MVAKRGLTNWANVHTKKSFKAQHGRISIDPAILAAIGQKPESGDQKLEPFLFALSLDDGLLVFAL